ncbi:hypothetical protein [Streptomyces sp. NBC_00344]
MVNEAEARILDVPALSPALLMCGTPLDASRSTPGWGTVEFWTAER